MHRVPRHGDLFQRVRLHRPSLLGSAHVRIHRIQHAGPNGGWQGLVDEHELFLEAERSSVPSDLDYSLHRNWLLRLPDHDHRRRLQ